MSLNPSPPSAVGRSVPLVWALVLVLVVAGAGVAVTAALAYPRPAAAPGSVTVTDDLGRTVTVPYDPARVVAFGASIVDLLYALGLLGHLVGVDCYAAADGGLADDYSSDQIALWNLSSSMCVQVEPEFVPSMLANLTPTLVLSSTIVSVAGVEQLTSELGVPLVFLQPASLDGIVVDSSLVGQIFGVTAAASALNARMNAELYNATNISANALSFPTVLVTYDVTVGGPDPGYWSYGPGTFGQSLLEITGASSISAGATTSYPELSGSQVLAAQPDWIVYGVGFGLNLSNYSAGPDWSEFTAVGAGNLSGINSNWLAEPDPTMILDGVPALLAAFHPTT